MYVISLGMIVPAIRILTILSGACTLPLAHIHRTKQISRPTVLFEVALSKLAQPQRIALNYAQKQRGCRGYVCMLRVHATRVHGP